MGRATSARSRRTLPRESDRLSRRHGGPRTVRKTVPGLRGADRADCLQRDELLSIALGRLVDELLDDRLAHRDLPAPAILGDGDGFVERFTEQVRYVLRSPRPAPRIAGLAFLKLGVSMSLRLSNRVHGRRAKPDLPARRLCRDLERLSILY